MSAAMLEVENLKAWYGAAQILFEPSFHVGRGEVVALMGRNGAGKSTTFKALMGLIPQRSGTVRFLGEDISNLKPFEIARRGLGFVPEDRRIFSDLTVAENLDIGRQPIRYHADGRPAPSWTPEKLFTIFPNLAGMPDRRGAHMSGGEQQMLTVARTLMGNPLLVLLDEPSEGVAPVIVEQMANTIIELKKEGLSVLLSEQNIHFAALVCDRAYVLEKGQLQCGTVAWPSWPMTSRRNAGSYRYDLSAGGDQRPPRARMARSRCGVTGRRVIAPGIPTASSMAAAIAAPTALTPPSPAPFRPSGLSGDGASWVISTSSAGTSRAVGMR